MKWLLLLLMSFPAWSQDCGGCTPYYDLLPQVPLPSWPLELINIREINHTTNNRINYCERPVEMVDTIVLHHTQSPPQRTAEDVNSWHITDKEKPYHTVAYTYLINAPYPGSRNVTPQVSEGRPLGMAGGHAGSEAWSAMTPDQRRLWDSGKVLCGYAGRPFKVDPSKVNDKGQIKSNITTIGVAVIGNYADYHRRKNREGLIPTPQPSSQTQDMIARLACQLQKKYPNMKSIKVHWEYNETTCPGSIEKYVTAIKNRAKALGCEFN